MGDHLPALETEAGREGQLKVKMYIMSGNNNNHMIAQLLYINVHVHVHVHVYDLYRSTFTCTFHIGACDSRKMMERYTYIHVHVDTCIQCMCQLIILFYDRGEEEVSEVGLWQITYMYRYMYM